MSVESDLRKALVAVAASEVDQEMISLRDVVGIYRHRLEAYQLTLADETSARMGVDAREERAEAAGEAALVKALGSQREIWGRRADTLFLKYFGAFFDRMNGHRLRELVDILHLQVALAELKRAYFERLFQIHPLEEPLGNVSPEARGIAQELASTALTHPRSTELEFLKKFHRVVRSETFSVVAEENERRREAYARASHASLLAARATAEAASVDVGLPDAVKAFSLNYLHSLAPLGDSPHPLLVDWARHVDAFRLN